MKLFILILTLTSLSHAQQYTYLLKKYDKEIALEAKIIAQIATESIKDKIKLYIPRISVLEEKIYSKYFTLSQNCEGSNFIFVNKPVENAELCKKSDKLFFTNNYKNLLSDKRYYGAFFWNKSRPNIVFIKNRLKKEKITLSKNYVQFVENID